MGNAESRRRRKEQKDRQQRKRQVHLGERRAVQVAAALVDLEAQVSGFVARGEAKVAVGMLPAGRDLILSMWDSPQPRVRTQRLVLRHDSVLDGVLAELLRRGIGADEWLSFLNEFLTTCASAGPGQAAISMMGWRAGEGPAVGIGSAADPLVGLPDGTGVGN